MKVLLVATSFDLSFGGPAFSVPQLASALAGFGVEVGMWAPNGSACRIERGEGLVCLDGTLDDALSRFGRPDIIHDNGIWLAHNHALMRRARRASIPRVVSARGMLEPWALAYKPWRKRLAWMGYQRRDLAAAALLHATAPMEAENINRLGLPVPVVTIPNGVEVPDSIGARARNRDGKRVALFLSRVHPKKGLPTLIEAWRLVAPPDWVLHIAGPDEAGHLAEVEGLISRAGLSGTIRLLGPVEGPAKAAAYQQADVFVLPSLSENFGIVIAEALAHATPVLTTTLTPWQSLVEKDCGWWVDPGLAGLVAGLKQATGCDDARRREMGLRGRALMTSDYSWSGIAKRFIAVYSDLHETSAVAKRA